jgi:alpha-L-fucosidase
VTALATSGLALAATAPHQDRSEYVEDPDPLVRQKIDQWQDLKLGLLMHWGPYSQWGIVES